MKSISDKLKNEEGTVLVVALMILVIVTLIGISSTTTSQIETLVSGNQRLHKIAFYAAEAARAIVPGDIGLYGPDNITPGGGVVFPENADSGSKIPLGPNQEFNGIVGYIGPSTPPRGSGYQAGKFKAHRYTMTCNGFGGLGAVNSESRVDAVFYRIGF
jgi:hypothetical protein